MNNLEMITPEIANERNLLIEDLKALVVNSVNLHHLNLASIRPETPFGPAGLNLDSVDILEVVVAVEQKFNVKVKDAEAGQKYFSSLGGVADFIMENRR